MFYKYSNAIMCVFTMSSCGEHLLCCEIAKLPEFVRLVAVFKVARCSIAYVSHL